MILNDMQSAEAHLAAYVKPAQKNYSLDAIRALMHALGNPQDALRVIHVAGTSGKTSTAYYAAALVHSSGHTVGLSVSPHIDTVRERTQVNGALLEESQYLELLGDFLDIVEALKIDVSYFELLVAFSYWAWNKLGVEYAVVEVGLGGLLDGTNVITRQDKICVITDIGYDHQEVLGETLPEIATQKAGIILEGNSVFMHEQPSEVYKVVRQVAENQNADLIVVSNATVVGSEDLPLFQQRNFSLAHAAATALVGEVNSAKAAQIVVPGRMEERVIGSKRVFLDGSHNAQKIGALVESFKAAYPSLRPTLIVSFGANRGTAMKEGLEILRQLSGQIIATSFSGEQDVRHQSLRPAEIADEARNQGFEEVYEVEGVSAALDKAIGFNGDSILIVGSFYALLDARRYMPTVKS